LGYFGYEFLYYDYAWLVIGSIEFIFFTEKEILTKASAFGFFFVIDA
jgi:hypothetical protein